MNKNFILNQGIINGNINQNYTENAAFKQKHTQEEDEILFDVAISYASEQERYVERVVKILEAEKIKVFYAPKRETMFKAQDMYVKFYNIYRYQCRYAACFFSSEYRNKEYTMHEYKTLLLRNKKAHKNFIIPIYFEKVFMEGLDKDISYLEADQLSEVEIADQIIEIVRGDTLEGSC